MIRVHVEWGAEVILAVPASGSVLPAQLSDKTTSVLCLAGS